MNNAAPARRPMSELYTFNGLPRYYHDDYRRFDFYSRLLRLKLRFTFSDHVRHNLILRYTSDF